MVITCPSCSERYRLNPNKLKGKGARITCPSCAHSFVVLAGEDKKGADSRRSKERGRADTRSGAFQAVGLVDEVKGATTTGSIRVVAPGPRGSDGRKQIATVDASGPVPSLLQDEADREGAAEVDTPEEALRASDLDFREVGIVTWKVKVAIGLVYDFSDIATLKKYLADKKVTPDDLISHNAKDWVRIGDLDDLDEHFVATWRTARAAMKEDERPARSKAASNTTDADEAAHTSSLPGLGSKSSSQEAAEQVAAMRKRRTRQRREQAMADEKRMRTRTFATVIAAILAVGLLFAFYMSRKMAEEAEMARQAAAEQEAKLAAEEQQASAGEDGQEVDAVRDRIREALDRRRQEIQAGVLADTEPITEDTTEEVEDEALVRARRMPVPPKEQTTTEQPADEFGYKKPIRRRLPEPRPPRRTGAQAVTSTANQGSTASITEKRARDPGLMYYDHGAKKLAEKNYGAALKMFQRSVDKSPGCGQCWEGLAQAHKALGNASEAALAFKKAEGLGIPVNASRP
ncbi:MAG: hypothetical protein CL928_13455 [Deltaproteobacteria bacterium]|nr:hypothetical protein [Deltaproteobacteria bacterium]